VPGRARGDGEWVAEDGRSARPSRPFLLAGTHDGQMCLTVGLAQKYLRQGFDPRLHPLSLLSWAGSRSATSLSRADRRDGGLGGAGVFVSDPGDGFRPRTPEPVGACFVFAVRFRAQGRTGWAIRSAVTGAGFLLSFMAMASGRITPMAVLTFCVAVAWSWIWLSAILPGEAARAEGR